MLWTSILRPIFDHQNIRIELNLWNRKLFIVELDFHIFLNHSISISESKVMVNTQGLFDHTKSDQQKKLKFHIWDSILRSIFDNKNIGIKRNSWNTKLFIIESYFQIFLNHSILMSNSEGMIKILKPHDHTIFNERKNANPMFRIAFWGPFLTMKTLESSLIRDIQSCS